MKLPEKKDIKKLWGQNFLINTHTIASMVDDLDIQKGQVIWEIGPGYGALTWPILEKEAHLWGFEKDPKAYEFLYEQGQKKGYEQQLNLVLGDACQTLIQTEQAGMDVHAVVGNLPYYLSDALVHTVFLLHHSPSKLMFLLQKQMAQRIVSSLDDSYYHPLSIILSYQYQWKNILSVWPEDFYPQPHVDSCVVFGKRKNSMNTFEQKATLVYWVYLLWKQKNKKIENNIKLFYEKHQKWDFLSWRFLSFWEENTILQWIDQQHCLSKRAHQCPPDFFWALAEKFPLQVSQYKQ